VETKYPNAEDRNLTNCLWRDHGYHLFEELIRVPLIIKGRGIAQDHVVYSAVENVDLIPTILALTGDAGPFPGDGRNLIDVICDREAPLQERPALFSHCNEGTCIIDPSRELKFIMPNNTGRHFGLDMTLYDLKDDPEERVNRLQDLRELSEDTARALYEAIMEKEKADFFKDMTGEMDEATRKKMEELGYL
jgi:arylsulfatase A-like enzyme